MDLYRACLSSAKARRRFDNGALGTVAGGTVARELLLFSLLVLLLAHSLLLWDPSPAELEMLDLLGEPVVAKATFLPRLRPRRASPSLL